MQFCRVFNPLLIFNLLECLYIYLCLAYSYRIVKKHIEHNFPNINFMMKEILLYMFVLCFCFACCLFIFPLYVQSCSSSIYPHPQLFPLRVFKYKKRTYDDANDFAVISLWKTIKLIIIIAVWLSVVSVISLTRWVFELLT